MMADLFARARRYTWLRPLLLAASSLVCVSACSNHQHPSNPRPGTGQNQPLIWDTGTWDNDQWT
jgi:hypothetical protein